MSKRKLKKINPYTPKWEKMANSIARDYVTMHVCKDCSRPVIQGYCCTWCGSIEP